MGGLSRDSVSNQDIRGQEIDSHSPLLGVEDTHPIAMAQDRALTVAGKLVQELRDTQPTDIEYPQTPDHSAVHHTSEPPRSGYSNQDLQLSSLTDAHKDELALLVAHRGVLFFRDRDITAQGQRDLFDYYGIPELLPDPKHEKAKRKPIKQTSHFSARDIPHQQ
ncbi:hypothetical protein BJX64DRAFT_271045 [Aspergillus heterothallicus]